MKALVSFHAIELKRQLATATGEMQVPTKTYECGMEYLTYKRTHSWWFGAEKRLLV